MKKHLILLSTLLSVILLFSDIKTPLAVEAVASIKRLNGSVDVQRANATIPGRKGLILHDRDIIVTNSGSKVTLIFRDGSIIRLFQNTRFLIEKSEESKTGTRRFFNNFRLKLGSFWGKFTKNRQKTVIKTPTATCGIKGTTVAFSIKDQKNPSLTVSLSTGKVSIKNGTEEVDLNAGKIARRIGKTGSIRDKITNLPYTLTITPDNRKITLPKPGNETEVYFTLQLIDIQTKRNINRSGNVYISHELDEIRFDPNIYLNSRGFARVKAIIRPLRKANSRTGRIEITAIMDGEQYLNVGSGQTILTYDIPKGKKRYKIDANSGIIQ